MISHCCKTTEKNLLSSDPVRIVYIIDSLGRGGTQTALINLIIGLSKKNYKQRVYCLNNEVDPFNRKAIEDCGANVRVIGTFQVITTIGIFRMIHDFVKFMPAIAVTYLFFSDTFGKLTGKIANVPILLSSIRARNIDKKQWQFFFDRLTAHWVDRVIFNSKNVVPFSLENEGIKQNQVVYIPNGISNPLQQCIFFPSEKRKDLGLSLQTKIIGSVGRISPQKGYPYLLKAFQLVLKAIPDCKLIIAGGGSLIKELQSLLNKLGISNDVQLLGDRADVPGLLSCIDVYVQSSLFEGMPNAVMEAMAAGKPVIATAVDGTLELIEEGKTGWLVEPANPELMAEKIIFALSQPQEAERVGMAAARRMAEEFSIEKMVDSYDNLFRDLIAGKE